MWLLTPSLNVITADWDPKSTSKTATLTINQTNFTEEYQMLRFHMVNVAFFTIDGSYTTQKVLIKDTEQTQVTYDASAGIVGILVNEGHQDFMKYRFDYASEDYFVKNINRITDPLTRMLIWAYMNEEVRDGLKKVVDYRDEVLIEISKEPEDTVYDFVLKFLNESTSSYLPSGIRAGVRSDLFVFVMSELTNITQLQKKSITHHQPQKGRFSNSKDQSCKANKYGTKRVKTL